MFEHEQNQMNQEVQEAEPVGNMAAQEAERENVPVVEMREAAAFAPIMQEPAVQPKKRKFGWLKTTGLCLLVGAVAFGGGYAGVKLAMPESQRIIIKEVGEGSGGDKVDGSTNTGVQALGSQAVAEKTVPSVVAIRTEAMTTGNFWYGSQVTSGAGSGVIISEDGYIVTNAHVVDGADNITVELSDGKTYKATLVGSYTNGDIAVIKIEATGLPAATFAAMDTVHQGEPVYAVGNPEGEFSGSITGGILSALDRQIQVSVEVEFGNGSSGGNYGGGYGGNYGGGYFGGGSTTTTRTITLNVLQFDAAVSPGNSGGGLFDGDGHLIGIVCAKSSGTDSEGLGFAIPGSKAQEIATALIRDGKYEPENSGSGSGANTTTNKAILGISAAYLDSATAQQYGYRSAGVYVIEITTQSTYQSGLRVGDRIISVDGTVVEDLDSLTNYLADKNPGDQVDLLVERSNKTTTLTITLVENTAAK